jgi:hypothetical protein
MSTIAGSDPYFSEVFVSFEREPSTLNLPYTNPNFGILNFTTLPCLPSNVEHDFVFVVDRSGSMSDTCSDGRSKMQHIIHTLKNMIIYFNENAAIKENAINKNIKINVSIFAFDDNLIEVIRRTQITEDNLNSILTKIDKIRPNNGTNIELALKEINKYILELQEVYPNNQINHIIMTDGEPTVGDKNPYNLSKLVNKNIYNSFVGFGYDHDANLLDIISSGEKNNYYFIDAIESAGLIYGEILHNLLYKLLYDFEITVENGLIYNYASNLWTNRLYIGDITGESNKIYHLLTPQEDERKCLQSCNVCVSFNLLQNKETLRILEKHNDEKYFTKFNFRQKTMALLYDANQNQQKKYLTSDMIKEKGEDKEKDKAQEQIIKKQMSDLLDEMIKYNADNDNINESKFIKNLCDDIYITRKTFGSSYGMMYSCARQTSQGTQRGYTVNTTPMISEPSLSPTRLTRHNNNSGSDLAHLFIFDEEPHGSYKVSNFEDAPYLSPTAMNVMRSISVKSNHSDDEENEENNDNHDNDDNESISFYISDDDDDM